MAAEGRKGRRHVVRMQLVGPRLADVREISLAAVPDQATEFRRPEPAAPRVECIGVVEHRRPQPDAAGVVEHIGALLRLDEFGDRAICVRRLAEG
jgi:hypothetical protein